MNKIVSSAEEAVRDIPRGALILAGGFGLCGIPENLIHALQKLGTGDLTIVSNNCGTDNKGLGTLLANGQLRKMISSYVGENKIFQNKFLTGELEVELCPQGTLAERIRAGGAGVAAFFTPTGFGTWVADGGIPMKYDASGNVTKLSKPKETRYFGDRGYVLEEALRGEFALVKAYKGDRFGNLCFRKTARNFNPVMATAARITIAEIEKLVEPGELDPDHIHTPGLFVHRVVVGTDYEKPIEQRTVRPRVSLSRTATREFDPQVK